MINPRMKKFLDNSFMTWRAGFALYRTLASAFFNAGGLCLLKRKYNDDISERKGIVSDVPENSIWVHAVSVGEVQSAASLIRRIKNTNPRPCIISTVTHTGHSMAENLLAGLVDKIIYSPFDSKKFVARALDNIRPCAYITMETELWPEMLYQVASRNIPAFLANGRISEKSFKRLRRTKYFWQGVLRSLTKLMVRFDDDKKKFLALGVPDEKIVVTGDCKVDTLLDRRKLANPEKWSWLKKGESPLFVAGSTHQGEDDVVVAAFRIVRKKFPDARLIIVPRHPERALMTVASALPYPELTAELLSRTDMNRNDAAIIVVDKIGVLFDLYSIADAVFVGGSLVEKGGQNPFEPALFGLPAIHGPSMSDFPDTDRMDSMGAAVCIHNDSELARVWEESLESSAVQKGFKNCEEYFKTLGGAAKKTWQEIEPLI